MSDPDRTREHSRKTGAMNQTDPMRSPGEGDPLQDKLRLFTALIDQSTDAIFVIDPATSSFLYANDTACRMLGSGREELLSLGVKDIKADKRTTLPWEDHVKALKEQGPALLEDVIEARDGRRFPVELNVRHVVQDGTEYLVSVMRDITDRKKAEEASRAERDRTEAELKKTNVWLQTLIQAIPDMVLIKDVDGRHLLVNKTVEDVMGLDANEIVGKTCAELMTPEPAEACKRSDDEAILGRAPIHVEEVVQRNGEALDIDFLKAPIFDARRNVIGLAAVGRDITERKKAEEELRSSREFNVRILDTVDEGFIVINRDFRIVSANNAYSRQMNLPVEEIIGRHCYEVSHRRNTPCHEAGEECAVLRTFETGRSSESTHKHHDRDGNAIYVEAKAYPIRDQSGAVASAIEVINNVTEKHLLEEQLLRTEKLEAVGLLAGGIAHDFNNLLQGVFGNISLAKRLADRKSALHRHLEDAETALTLSRGLTRQLLTFSKGGEPLKSIVALPPLIQNSVKFTLSGSNVDFHFSKDDDLWPVEADEGQISQVMQNIILNAGDAMPEGGLLKIDARNVIIEKDGPRLAKGKYVKITIEDSGTGIPERFLSRIFDPYFTTKQTGSGLGLATSYSIIKKHNGLLDVHSKLGAGSTFTLFLPAAEAKARAAGDAVKEPLTGKGRILFMDDEEVVRNVAKYMLQSLGYDADLVENGEQVIDRYVQAFNSDRPYDAVILDLTIRGGMGGMETIKKLQGTDPAVRAIVSSGYSDDPFLSQYKVRGFHAMLIKPYELEHLGRTLHSVLSAGE